MESTHAHFLADLILRVSKRGSPRKLRSSNVTCGGYLSTTEANEIRACAECNAETGPAACAKEIERVSKSDAEVAKYIETVIVPRCKQK